MRCAAHWTFSSDSCFVHPGSSIVSCRSVGGAAIRTDYLPVILSSQARYYLLTGYPWRGCFPQRRNWGILGDVRRTSLGVSVEEPSFQQRFASTRLVSCPAEPLSGVPPSSTREEEAGPCQSTPVRSTLEPRDLGGLSVTCNQYTLRHSCSAHITIWLSGVVGSWKRWIQLCTFLRSPVTIRARRSYAHITYCYVRLLNLSFHGHNF